MKAGVKEGRKHFGNAQPFLIHDHTLKPRLRLMAQARPLLTDLRGMLRISSIPKTIPAQKETGIGVALTLPILHPPPPLPTFLFFPSAYFGHLRLHRRTSSHVEPSLY
jgi:hypothetical protein